MKSLQPLLFIFFPFIAMGTTPTQDLLSPVTTKAAYAFWTGTAITTYLLISEDQISDKATVNTINRKPLGDASRYGDLYGQVYPNALYFLGMGAAGLFADDSDPYFGRAKHMFKATLYAGITTTIIKYTAREPRPYSSKEKNSFPSGHTTTAFAFASVVALHHEWYWGTLAVLGAGLTGYSRMNDGRHFLHDVVAGMTIGVSYGLGTYFTQYKDQGRNWALAPILSEEDVGLRLAMSW